MEDTPPEIRELVYRTVMARTEEERLLICAEMFETAREFAKIGMPAALSESERQAYIFRRIHGEDIPENLTVGTKGNKK